VDQLVIIGKTDVFMKGGVKFIVSAGKIIDPSVGRVAVRPDIGRIGQHFPAGDLKTPHGPSEMEGGSFKSLLWKNC